jgi:hypothetical protein
MELMLPREIWRLLFHVHHCTVVSGSAIFFCKTLYTNPTQAGPIIIAMATLLLSIYKGNFVVRCSCCKTDLRDTSTVVTQCTFHSFAMSFLENFSPFQLSLQNLQIVYVYIILILSIWVKCVVVSILVNPLHCRWIINSSQGLKSAQNTEKCRHTSIQWADIELTTCFRVV